MSSSPEPPFEFSYEFDVAFIVAALRRDFIWRGAVGVGLMVLVFFATRLFTGVWLPSVAAICGIGVVLVMLLAYRAVRVGARRVFELWARQGPDHRMAFRLDEEGFDVLLAHSSSRYTWQGLRRLWRYDDVWIIEVVKNVSVFFPPGAATQATRDFIVERCRSGGARV